MPLVAANPFLKLRRIPLDPAEDRGWVHLDPTFLHHLGQITIADPVSQYHCTHNRMISTGKRRRLKIDNRTAPRLAAPPYAAKVNATEPSIG
jgi:hypothetical protein